MSYIRFRNKDGETDHRVELVPENQDAQIETYEEKPLDMVTMPTGFGFCLSRDLCVTAGDIIEIVIPIANLRHSAGDYVEVIDKQTNQSVPSLIDMAANGGASESSYVDEFRNLFNYTRYTSYVYKDGEDLIIRLKNHTEGNQSVELRLPLVDPNTPPTIKYAGSLDYSTRVTEKNNWSVAFCIHNTEWNDVNPSCEGARLYTGPIDLNGHYDIYVGDMNIPQHTNVTAEQLADLYSLDQNADIEIVLADVIPVTLAPGATAKYVVAMNLASIESTKVVWELTTGGVKTRYDNPNELNGVQGVKLLDDASNANDLVLAFGLTEADLDEEEGWTITSWTLQNTSDQTVTFDAYSENSNERRILVTQEVQA